MERKILDYKWRAGRTMPENPEDVLVIARKLVAEAQRVGGPSIAKGLDPRPEGEPNASYPETSGYVCSCAQDGRRGVGAWRIPGEE